MRTGRVYWTAAPSHFYAEPKRLAKLGYLSAHKEPGRTRERTVYELTAKGRRAVAAWLAEPSGLHPDSERARRPAAGRRPGSHPG